MKRLDKTIQFLIPPSLVLLLVVTVIELFYHIGNFVKIFIDVFDLYVIVIFAIDLYYRWFETPKFFPYVKKHWLDIIATIPFNLIFLGVQGLVLLRGLRGVRILSRFPRLVRSLRLIRFGARSPRFLRIRKQVKEKKVRKVQPHEKQMKGVLSFRVILLITINSIMGTGIWFLTAAGAKHAGPASLISWGILSLISVYIAMCFSELTAMFPKAGGVYEFAKQAYGRFWSFVIGWTTSIAGSVTIAMLLLGALQYLIPLQYAFTYIPIAIGLIVLFNFVAYRGMQTSTVMLVSFALITLFTVAAILIPGFFNINTDNYAPFFVFPAMNILLAIFFIAETFFGWESAVFLSAETKNPTKVMPKALIYGTLVIALLAFLLSATSIGIIPWEQYAESAAPLRDLGEAHFGLPGKIIFTFLVFVSIIGAVASWIVTAPRLLMAIAEDKLFFVQFAKIHPKHKSPYVSIIFQVFLVSILVIVGAGQYEKLLHMLVPLILVVYSAVLLSVVVLRIKKPNLKRPYKVIFGRSGPFVTIFFMIFLLIMFIKETHGALDVLRVSGGLIAFGIPAYFAIELFYDPKYVHVRQAWLTRMRYALNKLPIPASLFNLLLSKVGPLHRDSLVVIVNAGAGHLTRGILQKSLPFRKIHAVSHSKGEAKAFKDKVHNKKVEVHFQDGLTPPRLKGVDSFICMADLGYVKNIESYLVQVRKILSKGGKFCFYMGHSFLDMTPNSIVVEDRKKMLAEFKKAGLHADYSKTRRLFKTRILVYGKKT